MHCLAGTTACVIRSVFPIARYDVVFFSAFKVVLMLFGNATAFRVQFALCLRSMLAELVNRSDSFQVEASEHSASR